MQEMSRCIQCTRCVRFGEEIGGLMEFGMVNRGDREEITTFLNKNVNSELSGNMIDVCPVGGADIQTVPVFGAWLGTGVASFGQPA